MSDQYVHVDISQTHRMSELEAAWVRLQLPHLEADNARRAAIACRYRNAAPGWSWQADHDRHVVHLCVARVARRDDVRAALADRGVATAVHYPLAITQQPAYRRFASSPCPEAERWAAECVTLPCFPELTDDEVDTVAAAIAEVRP
jgi:dTDP-4-amino-4,6-dideoxygalactose transaminase